MVEEITVLKEEITSGYVFLETPGNKPIPNEALAAKELEFENSSATNERITEAKRIKTVDDRIEKLTKAIEEADDEIETERAKKEGVIKEKINIEGLTYDSETSQFLFNGLPFDNTQINTASQVIAGLKIGASLLNDVRILKLDASLIDKDNFKKVQDWARDEQIELFIELVDREGQDLIIHIEENN